MSNVSVFCFRSVTIGIKDGRLYMQCALQQKTTKNRGKFENPIFDTKSLRKTVNTKQADICRDRK